MAREIRLTIAFAPGTALFLLVMTLVAAVSVELGSETLTMTTTYPSPVGIYRTMVTTSNTDLARQGGILTIGKNASSTSPATFNVSANTTSTFSGATILSGTTTVSSGGNMSFTSGAKLNDVNKFSGSSTYPYLGWSSNGPVWSAAPSGGSSGPVSTGMYGYCVASSHGCAPGYPTISPAYCVWAGGCSCNSGYTTVQLGPSFGTAGNPATAYSCVKD